MVVLMLQGNELPAGYTLAEKFSEKHRIVRKIF